MKLEGYTNKLLGKTSNEHICVHNTMKKIYINGFEYYYNTATDKLYLDEAMTSEVPKKYFTANEYLQYLKAIQ